MADALTFRYALARCGVTQPEAQEAVAGQGYSSMLLFSSLAQDEIGDFVKYVNKLPAAAANGVRPLIPHGSIRKLAAMRYWTIERQLIGFPVVHNDFTLAELARVLERLHCEELKSINAPEPPPLPKAFVSFASPWREFSDGIKYYCAVVRGCMNIPLLYLLREHAMPTAAMHQTFYEKSDDRLMDLVLLQGDDFIEDNRRLWSVLRSLVYGTPAWDYVKTYDKAKDGRTAFLTLQRRGEGTEPIAARRAAAEATIRKAQYTGKSSRFTLDDYIDLLQGAFMELEECNDPFSEEKKVYTFMQGLVSDNYRVHKSTIVSNPAMSGNFQLAYSFVVNLERVLHPDAEGPPGTSSGRNGSATSTEMDSYNPRGEWNKLSADERVKILSDPSASTAGNGARGMGAAATARKQKQKRTQNAAAKRKVAKLAK